MAKTVKRTYVNKKGQKVTKTYTYNKKYTAKRTNAYKGTVVYKSGKINEELLNELKGKMSAAEYTELKTELSSFTKGKEFKKTRLSLKSLISRAAATKIESFITNTGLTPDEVVKEINAKYNANIDTSYLLNEGNWVNGQLSLTDGQLVGFQFRYTGSILV